MACPGFVVRVKSGVNGWANAQPEGAHRLTAYYGYYKNTKAQAARERLRVDKLKNIASAVIAYHERTAARAREERMRRYV